MRVHPVGEHHQVKAYESHVMGERHPRQADIVLVETRSLSRAPPVGDDVAVREHDAFGLARRTGGKLDERDVFGPGALRLAGFGDVIELIDQEGA